MCVLPRLLLWLPTGRTLLFLVAICIAAELVRDRRYDETKRQLISSIRYAVGRKPLMVREVALAQSG